MGCRVKALLRTLQLGALVLAYATLALATRAHADTYFLTVAGLGGEPDYEQRFRALAADLDRILKAADTTNHVTTLSGDDATRAHLTESLQAIASQAGAEDSFVLILIGHGSYDGQQYKLNLVGPDISASGLAQLCNRIPARHQLIVNTTSSSGASLAALAHEGRAVIAATKSGTEKNATVFARYWVDALRDSTADVDKNDSISALEAFQYATAKTAAFYESQKRLATEHAIFTDSGGTVALRTASLGSGAGRSLSSFVLIRLGAAGLAAADPAKRALLTRKEQLEGQIDTLKYQRAAMAPEEYKQQLTDALVALAKVQEELDK
jgi:hypothetical protein